MYVAGFKKLIDETACVVAIDRMEAHPEPDLERFTDHLQSLSVLCPVLAADVRDSAQVVQLLELLLLQLDAKAADLNEETRETTCH